MKSLIFGLSLLIAGTSTQALANNIIDQLFFHKIELIGLANVSIYTMGTHLELSANCSRDQISKPYLNNPRRSVNEDGLSFSEKSSCGKIKFESLDIDLDDKVAIIFNDVTNTQIAVSFANCSVKTLFEDPTLNGFLEYEVTGELPSEKILDCELTSYRHSGHMLFKIL